MQRKQEGESHELNLKNKMSEIINLLDSSDSRINTPKRILQTNLVENAKL